MSLTEFHGFSFLMPEIQQMIWEMAAFQTRKGPQVFSFNLVCETNQLIEGQMMAGNVHYSEVHGPVLSPHPELRTDTQNERALLMACQGSRRAILALLPDCVNFTRARRAHEPRNHFNPTLQYPLYYNAAVDIICLSAEQVRECHQAVRHQVVHRQVVIPPQAINQIWLHDTTCPTTNWPLWFELKNIAIDITDPEVSLHKSGKAMEASLYRAISEILYHPASVAYDLRLFLANFGPVQYGDDGQPIDMTIDQNMPAKYSSSMLARYAFFQNGLAVDKMWTMLDEGQCLRFPDWARETSSSQVAIGAPARLLVPSEDGQHLVCVGAVQEPEDEDEDEEEADDDDAGDGDAVSDVLDFLVDDGM